MKLSELLKQLEKIKDKNPEIEDIFIKDEDGFLLEISFCEIEKVAGEESEESKDAIILTANEYSLLWIN